MNTILSNDWGHNFMGCTIRRIIIKLFYDFLGANPHKCNLIITQNETFSDSSGR